MNAGVNRAAQQSAVVFRWMQAGVLGKDNAAEIAVRPEFGKLVLPRNRMNRDTFLPGKLFSVPREVLIVMRCMRCVVSVLQSRSGHSGLPAGRHVLYLHRISRTAFRVLV